jgi:hypothetical protein
MGGTSHRWQWRFPKCERTNRISGWQPADMEEWQLFGRRCRRTRLGACMGQLGSGELREAVQEGRTVQQEAHREGWGRVGKGGYRARVVGSQGKRDARSPKRSCRTNRTMSVSVSGVGGRRSGHGLLATGWRKARVLKHMKHFRSTVGRLRHVRVFPAFNRFGHPPLFVALPGFASVQIRFAVCDGNQVHILQCPSGWVSERVFREFAEW